MIAACYDSDTVSVSRVIGPSVQLPDGRTKHGLPVEEPEQLFTVARPFGIARIGAVVMDPSGTAFSLLDREEGRIVTFPWPIDRGDLESLRLAYKPRKVEPITRAP
jgi:hypothetical protein